MIQSLAMLSGIGFKYHQEDDDKNNTSKIDVLPWCYKCTYVLDLHVTGVKEHLTVPMIPMMMTVDGRIGIWFLCKSVLYSHFMIG